MSPWQLQSVLMCFRSKAPWGCSSFPALNLFWAFLEAFHNIAPNWIQDAGPKWVLVCCCFSFPAGPIPWDASLLSLHFDAEPSQVCFRFDPEPSKQNRDQGQMNTTLRCLSRISAHLVSSYLHSPDRPAPYAYVPYRCRSRAWILDPTAEQTWLLWPSRYRFSRGKPRKHKEPLCTANLGLSPFTQKWPRPFLPCCSLGPCLNIIPLKRRNTLLFEMSCMFSSAVWDLDALESKSKYHWIPRVMWKIMTWPEPWKRCDSYPLLHCICTDLAFMILVQWNGVLMRTSCDTRVLYCGLVETWFQTFPNHVLVLRSLCQFWQTLLVCMFAFLDQLYVSEWEHHRCYMMQPCSGT